MSKKLTWALTAMLILSLALGACGGEEPEVVGGFEIPTIDEDKFNVAMVLIGPHDDGGWSQAHFEGLEYIEKNLDNVHTAYIENVPEGADSEQVFRSLSRKGFDLIFGTSFGYMDAMEILADEFPDTTYIHISGYKSNMENFREPVWGHGRHEVSGRDAGWFAGQDGRQPQAGLHGHLPNP